jgi:DNA-binding CsgD family transcriptional regulator
VPANLTPGEIRTLRTYCADEHHQASAKTLGLSIQTLKNHLGSSYRKLDAHKAHSALYHLCLKHGFDPFAAEEALINGQQPPTTEDE